MNNMIILGICIVILIILFLIFIMIIGKNKINEIIVPLDTSNQEINELLKQKYKVFKKMITLIKDNISIKEDAFSKFIKFDSKECTQSDLIRILNDTSEELNDYISKYDEILKNKDFFDLKVNLFNIQTKLEASIEFYNTKLNLYNNLKTSGPTSFATKFFVFDEYNIIIDQKKEISRLINLN